mmetsp:Transcript_12084/g.10687  ORF Transcript_12084/g.10687 Transcript_12084/m.10687 type:complete len:114 (+) Transcript_12084:158-499(+)
MSNAFLQMTTAWEESDYFNISTYIAEVQTNYSVANVYCNYDHFLIVFGQLTDFKGADWKTIWAFSKPTWDPNPEDLIKRGFWGSEFSMAWMGLIARMTGWVIEDPKFWPRCAG